MDPDLERINQQLSLVMEAVLPGMKPDESKEFRKDYAASVVRIEKDYKAAKATLADKNASDAEKKYAKDVADAINKNLPNMTKAALSAASAFKSGDYMNGSAAIMDIC